MQQHPIPQNVMSVEFQLVGNLTLRQFAYVGIGGVLAFLFFIFPLADWLKWPLVLLTSGLSVSLAYLPINDITLDRWVVAFFRAINSPTKRIWRREIKELAALTADISQYTRRNFTPTYTSDRSKLNEYLATLRANAPKSDLDAAEEAYLQSLPFEEGGPPPASAPKPTELGPADLSREILPPAEPRVIEEDLTKPSQLTPAVKPVITVHMPNKNIYVKKVSTTTVNRQLHSLSSLEGTIVLPVRGERTFEISEDLKNRLYPEEAMAQEVAASPVIEGPPPPPPAPVTPLPEPVLPPPVPEQHNEEGPQTDVLEMEKRLAQEAEKTRQDLAAKKAAALAREKSAPAPKSAAPPPPPPPAPEPAKPAVTGALPQSVTPEEVATLPGGKIGSPPPQPARKDAPSTGGVAPQPAIGKMAPPAANVPNVIVGLVRDASGMLVTDVVIIVKDPDGEPVRALKTNKVGQFAISTPLPNGDYVLELQKPGFKFDTIAVKLDGQIFQPIEIRSR